MSAFKLDIGINFICTAPRHRMKYYRECLVSWLIAVKQINNYNQDFYQRYLVPLMWNQAAMMLISKINQSGASNELATFAQSLCLTDQEEAKEKFIRLVDKFAEVSLGLTQSEEKEPETQTREQLEEYQRICETDEFYGDMHHEHKWDEFISIVPHLVACVQRQGLMKRPPFWWQHEDQFDWKLEQPAWTLASVEVVAAEAEERQQPGDEQQVGVYTDQM